MIDHIIRFLILFSVVATILLGLATYPWLVVGFFAGILLWDLSE